MHSGVVNLQTPFLTNPTRTFNSPKSLSTKRALKIRASDNQNQWVSHAIKFSRSCGKSLELLLRRTNITSRVGLRNPNCGSDSSNAVSNPAWSEGLLLFRGSVFVAVVSGICLLVCYGQSKAKGFIEARVLPSVCEIVSESIRREVGVGKVRSVSPLSVVVETCSVGADKEGEFSCGEVGALKLRVRLLKSLRKGKVVVDAVLFNPTLVVSQKKDYTWLGIPFVEGDVLRRSSGEEGIDYRTKTRRVVREEAAERWSRERDLNARESAELGYYVSERCCVQPAGGDLVQRASSSGEFRSFGSFHCMDENIHRRDHHCIDMGVDYNMKHADLEKSFGVDIPGSGMKFWSRVIKGRKKHKFMRKSNGVDSSAASIRAKRRVLRRSALAAAAYFQSMLNWKSVELSESSKDSSFTELETDLVNDMSANSSVSSGPRVRLATENQKNNEHKNSVIQALPPGKSIDAFKNGFGLIFNPYQTMMSRGERFSKFQENLQPVEAVVGPSIASKNAQDVQADTVNKLKDGSGYRTQKEHSPLAFNFGKLEPWLLLRNALSRWFLSLKIFSSTLFKSFNELFSYHLVNHVQKLKSAMGPQVENSFVDSEGLDKKLPVILDSIYFKEGTLMLLAYGDREPRVMENVDGHVKFQNHYGRVHVQLSGNCNMWRSDITSEDGGCLSVDVFVDILEQKWHANLKIANLFAPLFERILEIPITWSKGRASGEVHICMSRGETFPNLHGQLDVTGMEFQIYDAPSSFYDIGASLCFRGQRIFLHNASGFFGDAPLEASGDFGIHPDEGEFHLMCQVPCVEINSLMRTFKMKPLLFPLAGSVTAVFNCQGPLDAPIFVGSGMVSRKMVHTDSEFPASAASEAMLKSKEAGAVAAFDRVPFSYVSANFTFNTDNCVADLYGIRANLVDGGEIRGAGNAWMCPEAEVDDTALDVTFSGNIFFEKIMDRYVPGYLHMMPLKLGELSGETKLSGSLLRPRFDIKWIAPKAEDSFTDARGDITIAHDHMTVTSSSVAFELYMKVRTFYLNEHWSVGDVPKNGIPFLVEGVELDLRMRGFEFFSLVSSYPYPFDSPRPVHVKATGRIKFQGNVLKPGNSTNGRDFGKNSRLLMSDKGGLQSLVGDVSISGLKLNQLTLAPQLVGLLSISRESIKITVSSLMRQEVGQSLQLDATGRPDESLQVEVVSPSLCTGEERTQEGRLFSFSLQKGHLRANVCFRPLHSANLEVRHLPLDELELASLRGTLQRAEIQLNLQKRRGHGILSVLRPKFSGVLGEALDVAVRWSGDVITVERAVLEQNLSRYELQGEYVLPGSRDRGSAGKRGGLLERAMAGHLGSVISSVGRWRMRLEVPQAEVAEMLPLARLLSRSTDPAVRSRSKDFFIQSLQSVGLYAESLQDLLEVIRGHRTSTNQVILEDLSLPGLAELKGRWHGSIDASGGGNGDTEAEFDLHGEDWEWGTYKTQRVLAVGAYSNADGVRLERIFIQKDDATIHADGTLLGPKTNLHFAVLNFPIGLVPTLIQVIETSATDDVQSLRQLLTPIKGILHMEGDLRGSLAKPECDVQVRLLDGAIEGIDLGRAEVVASITSASRFLFNAKLEPVIQNGHVHIQGSIPVTFVEDNMLDEDRETDKSGATWVPGWVKEKGEGSEENSDEKMATRERNEEGWDTQLAESLKGLNWNLLDVGEVRIDADIKDGGMMLLTALSPHANWLHGSADIMLQLRGTVEQPVLDGYASFHRASISSPVLRKPLTNFGGTVNVKSNRLCISSLESKVSRWGKLFVKGSLPLRTSEASSEDKIELKCDVLEVRAKNLLSGQVDSQMQITGSILQPNLSGNIKLSHGEAYLPHDKGSTAASFNRWGSAESRIPSGGVSRLGVSRYVSRFIESESAASTIKFPEPSAKPTEDENEMKQVKTKPKVDVRLSDLKLVLGPELRIVYPLILNFAVSGELELNGPVDPKWIKPKGMLTFENGDVNLVATQVRLKREHLNVAKFEPEYGLDPMLDLALVGSEWQFRIQSRASNWQDNLVVTSTRSVEQDVLSPSEAAKVFESQLAESILEGDGKLAFKKLATATLETLMPRIEGKGEFGQARWRLVYAPQIPTLLSVDPTVDPLKSLASNISFGTEVEVQLGKRLQASIVRQMKDSEMAMQWTLIYQLTSRLRLLLQSAPAKRLLFEYSATSQS